MRFPQTGSIPAPLPVLRSLRAKDNPFRVSRVLAIRYRPVDCTWDELLARLERLQYQAAICGHEGSGKTTLLEDLAQRILHFDRPTHRLQLRRETRRTASSLLKAFLAGASARQLLLVDGAEQLGALDWLRLRRAARRHAGLIITAHTPGRLPTLVECRTSVELLEELVERLAPQHFEAWRPHLAALFLQHGGNLRLCLRTLYDWCAAEERAWQPQPAAPAGEA